MREFRLIRADRIKMREMYDPMDWIIGECLDKGFSSDPKKGWTKPIWRWEDLRTLDVVYTQAE